MADLDQPPAIRRQVDQAAGFVNRSGDRLLHHDIAAGFDQLAGHFEVQGGRRGDDGRVDLSGQLGNAREPFQAEVLRDLGRHFVIGFDEPDRLRFRHLRENPGVQAAEVAGADDADAQRGRNAQRMNPRCELRTNSAR